MTELPSRREYAKIVAKVWADPEFGERLRANPVEVLRSEGIDVPERTQVVDLSTEAYQADYYLLLPPKPASLDEDLLELVSERIGKVAFTTSICIGTPNDAEPPQIAASGKMCISYGTSFPQQPINSLMYSSREVAIAGPRSVQQGI